MFLKINLQYLFSYLGLIPLIVILIDKFFFNQIKEEIILDFFIYYTLLIFVFIGAVNWKLENKLSNYIVFYGFLPSLLSTIIIILNLYEITIFYIFLLIILLFFFQLILDYFIIYTGKNNRKPFFLLRLPLSILIITCLLFAIY